MINSIKKAQNLLLLTLANTIQNMPAFNFGTYALSLPFSVANATYGVTQAEYNHLFIPDISNMDGICGPDQEPTITTSTGKRIAYNIRKFVAYFQTLQ